MKNSWGPLAPRGRMSHLAVGFPRVMPAHTQPSPACPRSSAPPWPKTRFSYLGFSGFGHRAPYNASAFPTRSQKSSGALPARLTGVARGHPARGNGSWERSVPLPFFAKRLQNHCRGYLPGVAFTSADFISGRNGVFKGVSPLTRFSCLLTCIKRQSSCGGETPPGHAPGGNAEESAY